jgi:hypothetical protein
VPISKQYEFLNEDMDIRLTLNRLALVPIINPAWSSPITHDDPLMDLPFDKCVPAYDRFIPADRNGSYDAISSGVILYIL